MDQLAASSQALAHNRVLGNLSDTNSSVKDTATLLGVPDRVNDAQSPAPVEPARDVVDVDPFAQSFADLQAILERLQNASSGEGAREVLSDLRNFVNDNTNAEFAGGVLSEVSELVGSVLDTLEDDPEAFGNFVSFDFNFQFSQESLQTSQTSLEATSFSFDFSFVSENTAFSASLDFSEETLQTADAVRYISSESAQISIVTNNLDLESNPALDGFIDIANRLLGPGSPFAELLGVKQEAPDTAVDDAAGGNGNVPMPEVLRNRLLGFQQSIDTRERTMELLETLFANITEQRGEVLSPPVEVAA